MSHWELPKEKVFSNAGENRATLRNDLILFGAILLLSLIAGCIFLATRETGEYAVVSINGTVYATYSLSHDVTVELPTGSDGVHRNVLVIENGKAAVSEADCRDGICVRHSPISEVGETIVCLPNRMVVEIQKGD